MKLQAGKSLELTAFEKVEVQRLKITDNEIETVEDLSSLSLAARALKKRRIGPEDHYMDTRFIIPTSNICERLFSKTGYALSDRRKRLLPQNFEQQVFLHANAHL